MPFENASSSAELPANSWSYRADIDGLRALAVGCVVLFHAFPTLLPGGYVGVDIFFVISGFLITSHIWGDIKSNKFSLIEFYGKRIRRIYPALLLVLVGSIIFGWVVLFDFELRMLFKDAASSAVFISNIVFWRSSGYFDPAAETQPLLHLWSLGIEEQFYIFWPILLTLLFIRKAWAFYISLFFLICSFLLNVILVKEHPNAAFYLPLTRFWELWAGALLALANSGDIPKFGFEKIFSYSNSKKALSLIGFFSILAALIFISPSVVFPGWWALLPVLGAVCIIGAGSDGFVNKVFLRHSWLVYVGLLSYSLYLWHWPIMAYLRILSSEAIRPFSMIFGILISFLFSAFTYHFVEIPFRRLLKRVNNTRIITGALFFSLLALGLIAVTFWVSGFSNSRFYNSEFSPEVQHGFELSQQCKREYPSPSEFCRYSSNMPQRIFLLGDSHANHLFDSLTEGFQKKGLNLVAVGSGNCQPFYGVETHIRSVKKRCPEVFDALLDQAFESQTVKAVILSSYAIAVISGGFNYGESDGLWLSNANDSIDRIAALNVYLGGLTNTLQASFNAKRKVVLVLDNPELDFDPISCIGRPLQVSITSPCAVDRYKVRNRLNFIKGKVRDVAKKFPNVSVIDPEDFLCDKDQCYAELSGKLLYIDRNHLSISGAAHLSQAIISAASNFLD